MYVSAEEEAVLLGHNVWLSCNVSGHPYSRSIIIFILQFNVFVVRLYDQTMVY